MRREGEEEEEEEKRRRKKEGSRREKVWKSMDFCMEKSNHKPFFFMNLGLKEPYLVYWWRFAVLD